MKHSQIEPNHAPRPTPTIVTPLLRESSGGHVRTGRAPSVILDVGQRSKMPIVTTLNFYGQTEAALKFYAQALNAEIVFLMRFKESPDQRHSYPGTEDLIFHATFRIEGTEFMASDVGYSKDKPAAPFAGFSLALNLSSVEKAKRYFSSLSSEGRTIVPLAPSAFTGWYGIVVDRFGLSWKINVQSPNA